MIIDYFNKHSDVGAAVVAFVGRVALRIRAPNLQQFPTHFTGHYADYGTVGARVKQDRLHETRANSLNLSYLFVPK